MNYDKHEIMLYITFCYTFDFVLFVFVKLDSKDIFLLFFSFFLLIFFIFRVDVSVSVSVVDKLDFNFLRIQKLFCTS